MHISRMRIATLIAILVAPLSAGGQEVVGHPPDQSPFRDLDFRQEITPFAGWFVAGRDPAGVAPRSGATLGIRYEAMVGGPIALFARLSTVRSERQVIDPLETPDARDQGVQNWPLYLADFGLAVNLTGQRSYHRLVPALNAGFGFVSDGNRGAAGDPFTLGTPFALVYGGSIRYVPGEGRRFQLRVGMDNYLYRLSYPSAYFTEDPPVVPATQRRSFWKNNTAFTIGGSLLFLR
jgi:hypothetical protein